MSRRSKGNILFAFFLIVLIIGSISTTYYLITKHNSKTINNSNNNYFTFKEVSKKDTIDVSKEYPINPIDINLEGQVKISGLKNKEVENKINEKLAKLDASDKCYVHFNFSNVLGINDVNVNLINGEDITIEDIFQKDSDILAITEEAIYRDTYYSYFDADKIENYVINRVNFVKNGDYTISLYNNSIYVWPTKIPSYLDYIIYDFSTFMNEITIYDRFLTDEELYEKEVTEYCRPKDCEYNEYINEYDINKTEYLSPNNILIIDIYNSTNSNLDGSYGNEMQPIDLSNIYPKIRTFLDDTYNFRDEKNYQIVRASVGIYSTNYGYKQAICQLEFMKFDKENYAKYLLDGVYAYATPFETKSYIKSNIVITDDNEVKVLEDNPNLIFKDFKETLYNYLVNNKGIHYTLNDIDRAAFAINLENKTMYMAYCDEVCDYNLLISSNYIPFDIFTLK